MGDIINLKTQRKRRQKAQAAREADENRMSFGRTKAEKQFERKRREQDRHFLDANRLERETGDADN